MPAVSAGDQAPQRRLGGPDDQLAVVGDDHVVAALDGLAGRVAEVVGDQGGRAAGPITIRSHVVGEGWETPGVVMVV
jgi:hypothetical protein